MLSLFEALVLSALLLITLLLFCIIFYICYKITQFKKIKKYNARRLAQSKVILRRVVDFNVQMQDEETINHEFDSSRTYREKTNNGTQKLNLYKKDNNVSICKIYKVG